MTFKWFKKLRARLKENWNHDYAADPDNERDHTHDDDMKGFEYWHYKLTGFNPAGMAGMGQDGKRATWSYSHEKARRCKSYERRKAERKAVKAAAKAALQREEEERRVLVAGIDVKPKRKMTDVLLLPLKRDSRTSSLEAQMSDVKMKSYGLEDVDLGRTGGPNDALNALEGNRDSDLAAREQLPPPPPPPPVQPLRRAASQYHDAVDGLGQQPAYCL
ncbi:uncharacterized protein RCC_07103 [Ramularia collo-cygni]|uniref:Uncharacterized protein n=1 Tax=Ramularia collo-cygni TaxID=112498 RepID=A0A2D3V717_9PEZI|nr:uncharacterized protein RCC_07103 [Ramularia collo-cygni]CZT21240.1 uncharacterized protein RCC_07103 [Ramularia collo-cygni]